MQAQIGKWGKSLGFRIPASMTRQLGLKAGESVDLRLEGHRLVVEPTRRVSYTLADLMENCNEPLNEGVAAYDWGAPVGSEVW